MSEFRRENLQNIRTIFEERTGVCLSHKGRVRHPVLLTAALVVVLACLMTTTVFAGGLFSSLSGDRLSLSAVYEGGGVVAVTVENKSGKELSFQPIVQLKSWVRGDVEPAYDGDVTFTGSTVPPHETGVMTIDLSAVYDMELLEQPLQGDWYYLVLTNGDFAFGQDWTCTVDFAATEAAKTPAPTLPPVEADTAILARIDERLRPYFADIPIDDMQARDELTGEYLLDLRDILDRRPGTHVPSTAPTTMVWDPNPEVVFDDDFTVYDQYTLLRRHWRMTDWTYKLLATGSEQALVLYVRLPMELPAGSTYREMPLFYVFTYDKSQVEQADAYAFIYGQFLSFDQLEAYKIYDDEQYVSYEISELIYSDLWEHTQRFLSQNPQVTFDDSVWAQIERVYGYYKEHLGNLFYFR